MPQLLEVIKDIFIEFKEVELPITATIALMKSCLYMKIVSFIAGDEPLKNFQACFEKAGIFELIVNLFAKETEKESPSKYLCTKMMQFVTFMIYDLPRLYFDNISGVRLETLIKFQSSNEARKRDADIVRAHTKLVNACCHCLFEWNRDGKADPKELRVV